MLLEKIAENLWIYEGETVSFFHLLYSTRMTVIRLNDQRLWIHSSTKLNQYVNNVNAAVWVILEKSAAHGF